MVVVAERNHLVDVGPTAIFPEFDVMRLRPARRPVASRPGAGLVPRLDRPPLRRLRRPLGSAHVDHHGVRLEHPVQDPVAGEALHGLARDRSPARQLRGRSPQLALQALDGGVDGDMGPRTVALRQPAAVEDVMRELGQRVRAPLLGSPGVVRAQGGRQ